MKKIYYGISLLVMLFSVSKDVHADTLVGTYTTGSTPSIVDNTVNVAKMVGNILYAGTSAGVSVIDTNGTATLSDDTNLGSYTTSSTPAIPGGNVTQILVSGNLVYIGSYASGGGVAVIDTNGTAIVSDDTLMGTYTTSSSPAITSSTVKDIELVGSILYVSMFGGGVTVINTNGTGTFSDDSLVGNYSTSSTPAIGNNNAEHAFALGNIMYFSTRGGVSVIDTQGTITLSDDTLVGNYSTSSTPALANASTEYSYMSGTILYILIPGTNVTVIETNGTATFTDDTLLGTYSTSTSPALGSNLPIHLIQSGNLLYISTVLSSSAGLTVIDTQGTSTLTDDALVITYNTSSTPALNNSNARHSFLSGNLIYIGTDFGLAVVNTQDPLVSTDTVNVSLPVNATISITAPADVVMGAITGTGQSALATNSATWNIKTNNSAGYALAWQSSSPTMTNANLDTIASFTPNVASTPQEWVVANTDSEWGAKLASTSTTYEPLQWGIYDDYQAGTVCALNFETFGDCSKWLNVDSVAPYTMATRSSETSITGDDETVIFGGEIGTSKIQPTGTYSVDVTLTATTL